VDQVSAHVGERQELVDSLDLSAGALTDPERRLLQEIVKLDRYIAVWCAEAQQELARRLKRTAYAILRRARIDSRGLEPTKLILTGLHHGDHKTLRPLRAALTQSPAHQIAQTDVDRASSNARQRGTEVRPAERLFKLHHQGTAELVDADLYPLVAAKLDKSKRSLSRSDKRRSWMLSVSTAADVAKPDAFVAWAECAADAPRIVILGDLFEYWVGPAQLTAATSPKRFWRLRAGSSMASTSQARPVRLLSPPPKPAARSIPWTSSSEIWTGTRRSRPSRRRPRMRWRPGSLRTGGGSPMHLTNRASSRCS
jgi:hypothetical protein